MRVDDEPLFRTTRIGRTDYWNDSCATDELAYAIERGATGATCNPVIVVEVLAREKARWAPRLRELAAANPTWSEADLAWAITEELAVQGAGMLLPIFEREHGRKGWQSVQVNPANHGNAERMVEQAVRFASLAPNIQVKFPATAAGIAGMEAAVALGVNVNSTVSFTLPQALASAAAIERGLDRFERAGGDPTTLAPICTIMVGRLDDWLKALVERDQLSVDPAALDRAGIAVMKRAYAMFRERGYRSRLLAAAYRHHLHWTELVGGDLAMTIPWKWQVRFNKSGIVPTDRIGVPVDPRLIAELCQRVPDFRRAYEPDGMTPGEFDTFGATVRTLRGFTQSFHDLQSAVRDIVLPNPDRVAA